MRVLIHIQSFIILCILCVCIGTPALAAEPLAKASTKPLEWVQLFPNPVVNEITIYAKEVNLSKVEVSNIQGEVIFSSLVDVPIGARITVNMNYRARGFYIVKIHVDGGKQTVTYKIYKM